MERLTYRLPKGGIDCAYCDGVVCGPGCDVWNKQLEKLAEYEDNQEQGLAPVLMPNDTVWDIDWGKPREWKVTAFSLGSADDYLDEPANTNEITYYCQRENGFVTGSFTSSEIGEIIFATREEAEEVIKKGGGKRNGRFYRV